MVRITSFKLTLALVALAVGIPSCHSRPTPSAPTPNGQYTDLYAPSLEVVQVSTSAIDQDVNNHLAWARQILRPNHRPLTKDDMESVFREYEKRTNKKLTDNPETEKAIADSMIEDEVQHLFEEHFNNQLAGEEKPNKQLTEEDLYRLWRSHSNLPPKNPQE
ncbi:hypothetical protein H4R33_000589 [Dimargaris cristalligena]|nr:hypothetical protein H4R33_000589 [Dimargaris cristalligena]